MTAKTIIIAAAVATLAASSLAAPSAFASDKGRNTLLGGLAGAGAGAALTHGSVGGALIGAAGGALIGNSITHRHHRRYYRSHRRYYGR